MKFSMFATLLGLFLCACNSTHEAISPAGPPRMGDQLTDLISARDTRLTGNAPASADPAALTIPSAPTSSTSPTISSVSTTPGSVRTIDEPLRPIEGAPSGRVWLLEMYQTAVTQRDESIRRACDIERERDEALARAAETEKARADLQLRNTGLASELQDLRTKALELARRLAEMEIARLEAEKAAITGRSSTTEANKP